MVTTRAQKKQKIDANDEFAKPTVNKVLPRKARTKTVARRPQTSIVTTVETEKGYSRKDKEKNLKDTPCLDKRIDFDDDKDVRRLMELDLDTLTRIQEKAEWFLQRVDQRLQRQEREFNFIIAPLKSKVDDIANDYVFPELAELDIDTNQEHGDFATIVEQVNSSRLNVSEVRRKSKLSFRRSRGKWSNLGRKSRVIPVASTPMGTKRAPNFSTIGRVGWTGRLADSTFASRQKEQNRLTNSSFTTGCCLFQRSLRASRVDPNKSVNRMNHDDRRAVKDRQGVTGRTGTERDNRPFDICGLSAIGESEEHTPDPRANTANPHVFTETEAVPVKPKRPRYLKSGECIRIVSSLGSPLRCRSGMAFVRQIKEGNQTEFPEYTVFASQTDLKSLKSRMGRRTRTFMKPLMN